MSYDGMFRVWAIIYIVGSLAVISVAAWTHEFELGVSVQFIWIAVVCMIVLRGRWVWDECGI